ncbi:hypothetical protein B0H34DRAFT_491758 [Crassisporium funariophilum]|nr:hypothetical protein B0H34DRAFT_491758 [Crassisporium funariophilum]
MIDLQRAFILEQHPLLSFRADGLDTSQSSILAHRSFYIFLGFTSIGEGSPDWEVIVSMAGSRSQTEHIKWRGLTADLITSSHPSWYSTSHATMKFHSTLTILATLAAISLAATVTDVENDIKNISSQTTTLDNAITAFPATGGSLLNALAIHSDAVSLGSAIDKGTTDVKVCAEYLFSDLIIKYQQAVPPPISEADGTTILNAVTAFEPTILDALNQIVVKKPAFQALPIGGIPALVKQDLINLSASTSAFEAALIAAAPVSAFWQLCVQNVRSLTPFLCL